MASMARYGGAPWGKVRSGVDSEARLGEVRYGMARTIGFEEDLQMERKEAIDALVAAVEAMDYGAVMSFRDIGSIIGQQYGSMRYNDILQAARKRLVATGHMIVNMRGVGYKVCQPDDYTGEGVRRVRQGARRIDRGAKVLNHAPVNDMTPAARAAHNRVNDRMVSLQAAMAGANVEIHMLCKSRNPLLAAK